MNEPGQERMRGWANPCLDDKGREDAQRTAAELRSVGAKHIVTSDLLRAYETAEIIARANGAKVDPSRTLRPWDYGYLTGQPVTKDNNQRLQWYVDHPDVPVPDGESFNTFAYRFLGAMERVFVFARGHSNEVVIVVTHSRNIAVLLTSLNGSAPNKVDWDDTPDPAGFCVLKLANDKWVVEK